MPVDDVVAFTVVTLEEAIAALPEVEEINPQSFRQRSLMTIAALTDEMDGLRLQMAGLTGIWSILMRPYDPDDTTPAVVLKAQRLDEIAALMGMEPTS